MAPGVAFKGGQYIAVVVGHRGRPNDQINSIWKGYLTDVDVDALFFEGSGDLAVGHVRASDIKTAGREHSGQSAHATSADARHPN